MTYVIFNNAFEAESKQKFCSLLYLLTSWSRVLPEKLTGRWPVRRFFRILWNPKVRYCIDRSPPPVPILSHIDPVRTSPMHFSKIHFNVIFLSTPGSSKWSTSLRSPHQNPVCTPALSHTFHMPRRSHSFLI
jgi:hypothetical protein